jgi:hypothetical protein
LTIASAATLQFAGLSATTAALADDLAKNSAVKLATYGERDC